MKKVFSLLLVLGMIIFNYSHLSANNFITEYCDEGTVEDCDDYAAMDYEITGDSESAEQAFYDCMDDAINELERDMSSIP